MKRVEVLIEAFLGALADMDGVPDSLLARAGGGDGGAIVSATASSTFFAPSRAIPKNRCPFQCPPVTSLVMALSYRSTRLSYRKPSSLGL